MIKTKKRRRRVKPFPPIRKFIILANRALEGVAPVSFTTHQYGLYLLRKIAQLCQYGRDSRRITLKERELTVATLSDFVYQKRKTKHKRFSVVLALCQDGIQQALLLYPEKYTCNTYYEEIIGLLSESVYNPEKMSCFFEGTVASLERYARMSSCA